MRLANKRIADLECDLNNTYFNEDGTVKKMSNKLTFEERVEIMSKKSPDEIRAKWEKTGLLDKLSDEKAYQISQLCENQARHLLFTYSNDELNGDNRFASFLSHICFPMIRRIFVGVEFLDSEVKPAFTFETSVTPAFTVFRPDKYDGKEDYAVTATTYEFESFPGLDEVRKWAENSYTALDGEVEISIRLEELFINELNEKYDGKHIIFYTPITAIKSESGNDTLGYRCAILPGGSRLALGKYEERENDNDVGGYE